MNIDTGKYVVDIDAIETAGYLGGFDHDTIVDSVGVFYFHFGDMYTMTLTDSLTPLPILGHKYENTYEFKNVAFKEEGTQLQIAGERWAYSIVDGKVTLTRVTNYGGMGMNILTLTLTEV